MRTDRDGFWPRAKARIKARLKATWLITASRPHVILVPLALMGLMMGLGIWAVIAGAAHQESSERGRATSHVEAAASTLQLSIERAALPAVQLADWIQHTLNYSTIQKNWLDRVEHWFGKAPASCMFLSMTPQGVVANSIPDIGLIGLDVLAVNETRPAALQAIKNADVTVTDPLLLLGTFTMSFNVPIFVSNVSKDENWGIPFKAHNCPAGTCYNATTRTKWWGSATVAVNASHFIQEDGPLSNLLKAGYNVQIFRPANPLFGETERVAISETGKRPQPPDAIRGLVQVANSEWEVYIWVDSWEPSWKVPLIAAVVVASIICGCLIFAVLLSWEENNLLLHSILPESTIYRMKTDMEWRQASHGIDNLRLVEIETPAQHMQSIIQAILAGEAPPMPMVVAVQQALKRSADVYRPANQDLRLKLDAGNLDSDVQRHLGNQLAGTTSDSDVQEMEAADDIYLTMPDAATIPDPVAGGVSSNRVVPHTSRPAAAIRNRNRTSKPGLNGTNGINGITTSSPDIPALDLHETLAALVARPASGQAAATISVDDGLIPAHGSENAAGLALAAMVAVKPMANPEKPIMEQLDRVLGTADSWTFDIFELEEVTQGHSLSVLGYWLMHKSGCMEHARMDGAVLSRFLRRVEAGYKKNPYHNSCHAADVLQKFHVILQFGGLTPGYCDQLTLLGCYLAAIVHDYEHGGYSNDYLINTNDELAVRYNDRSPMENHHLAAAWGLMNQPGFNCLSGLSKGSWDKLRKLVIELVLATDMRQHFAILGQFSTLHNTTATSPGQMSGKASCAGESASSLDASLDEPLVPSGEHDKLLSLQIALKCADVGNLASPRPVYLRWVAALEEELFLQGDSERAKGMTISPLCDRTKEGVTKSQVGFFDFVVLPLFGNFTQKFKASKPLLNAVVTNYRWWQVGAGQSSRSSIDRPPRASIPATK